MPIYLVGYEDTTLSDPEDLLVVSAPSKEHALATFAARFAVSDTVFLDHVRTCSVNMSFAEDFWLVTEREKSAFSNEGLVLATKQVFARRVRKFFGGRSDWAERFLSGWDACVKSAEDDLMPEFPADMLIYIFVNIYLEGVIAIEINEIPHEEKISAQSDIHSQQPAFPKNLPRTSH